MIQKNRCKRSLYKTTIALYTTTYNHFWYVPVLSCNDRLSGGAGGVPACSPPYSPPNSSAEELDALLHFRPLSGVYLLSPPDGKYFASAWCSSRRPGTPKRPPTKFGRNSSMILEPWPQPLPPLKLSCRLKNAGNMLNCWGSGSAVRGGAGGSTAPAHAELLNSTVLWPARWLSDQRGSPALLSSCSVPSPSPSARPRRSLTNHIIVTWHVAPRTEHAAPRVNCSRLRERNSRRRPWAREKRPAPIPHNRCKIFIGMLRLIHPRWERGLPGRADGAVVSSERWLVGAYCRVPPASVTLRARYAFLCFIVPTASRRSCV